MLIKLPPHIALRVIIFFILLLCGMCVKAQVVFENPKHQIYEFLSRQAQKGNIEITDFILPLSRNEIAKNLIHLQDSVHNLSLAEQKELMFYQQEFSEFSEYLQDSTTFLKKDQNSRLRALTIKKDDFILRLDPAITLETEFGNHKNLFRKGVGLQFWGHASKHITFQAYFQDITEEGTGLDTLRLFTPETGIVRTQNAKPDARSLNYSSFKGNITYSWENGYVSVG
ncbi:MAG: hypothetical protein WBP45_14095, partial [Daejeonella sp.]